MTHDPVASRPPRGITSDRSNNRIQKFANTGRFLETLGCNISGSADASFSLPHPAMEAVSHRAGELKNPSSGDRTSANTAATPPTPAAAADGPCSFWQEGEYWTLTYRGGTARLRDTKGLHCIARLLADRSCELHVRDLAAIHQPGDPRSVSESLHLEGDLGAILDARATAQYKDRLAEARQELEEATAAGDLGHAARARHEIETITEQLLAAYGLGGRPRRAGDPAERLRKAVTNQIRRALDRICAAHPDLGRHLTNALRTGFVCAYRPEHPVAWHL